MHHDFDRKEFKSNMDLLCFSHLRWDFVYQRPQHLMSRFAKNRRVLYIEEPMDHDGDAKWRFTEEQDHLIRCIPMLPAGRDRADDTEMVRGMVDQLAEDWGCRECVAWFYTPMMLEWAAELSPVATVYDCMDELSKFRFAPGGITQLEDKLFKKADLVFTGGRSLYLAKTEQHASVHEFPSSIDAGHFRKAFEFANEMPDQVSIPHPRIGYAGVIDERIDLELVAAAADKRPDWSFVMLGPVVKIDAASLPQRENIYYLGSKNYADLPGYFSGWDVGMMPFALNESTEFISPTKTPEYLSAGLPVVSTPITDVVNPYGEMGLVQIAVSPEDFIDSIEFAMAEDRDARIQAVEEFLADRSWDRTFMEMDELITGVIRKRSLSESVPVGRGVSHANWAV
jgi:glycosyltransferase involved in cell wall biosynthesis